MKKYLLMVALIAAATLLFASCGKDEPKDKTKATATYTMSFSQDLLDAASIIIYYKAENGRTSFDAINSTWWTKTITSEKFPAEFGVMCNFGTKSETELNKDKYNLYCDFSFSGSTNRGANYSNNKIIIIDEKDVAKRRVVSTLDKYNGKKKGFKVSENGIFTEADNLKFE